MLYIITFLAGSVIGIFGYKLFKCAKVAWHDEMAIRNRVSSWPRAHKTKSCVIAFLLLASTGKAQVFAELGAGMTNKYFSAELQAGYRYNNLIASAGFISIPNNTQPVLFNIRAGAFFRERVMIYAGYVRNQMSTDFKWMNKNGWQVGAQYHMLHFDKGTMYIGANYTSGNYVSGQVGMSYNLSQGIN